MWKVGFWAVIAALGLAAPAQAAACTAERARYVMDGDANHRLEFSTAKARNAWSALVVTLSAKTGDRRFAFTASNGYSFNYLVPEDPTDKAADEASLRIFFFGQRLEPLDIPTAGDTPPAYIFAPDLGPLLWYGPQGGGSDYLPIGMWRFAGCRSGA